MGCTGSQPVHVAATVTESTTAATTIGVAAVAVDATAAGGSSHSGKTKDLATSPRRPSPSTQPLPTESTSSLQLPPMRKVSNTTTTTTAAAATGTTKFSRMGVGKTKKKSNSSSSNNGAHVPSTTTRPRADTWELPLCPPALVTATTTEQLHRQQQQQHHSVTTATTTTTSQNNSKNNDLVGTTVVAAAAAIQHQWKTLWETQSPAIVDPADVVSVLDSLRATTINRNLSPVQLTLLQRRVRAVVKHTLPKKSEQGTTSKKIAKVFAAGTSSTDSEARNAIDKYHVLTPTVLQRVLPSHPTVSDSIIMLMLALSFCRSNTALLTDRVLIAAKAAAEQAGLEMDVNKQQQQMTTKIKIATENASAATDRKQNGQAMPKPSQVSVLDEPVEEWPIGASFCAVATILALATGAASRTQRLQLLFYALMDVAELREFLALHPAGGVPVWLLEVGNNTVVSLPSLTHYHYYGTAFLPCEGAAEAASINERLLKPPTPAVFVASKSHVPVKVSALKVQRIVGDAYRRATAHSSMNGSSSHNHNNNTNHNGTSGQGGYPLDEKRPASSPKQMNSMSLIGHPSPSGEKRRTSFRRSSSANDLLAAESSVDPSNVEMPNGSNKGSIPFKTTLMMKLRDVSDGIDSDPYSRVATELDQSYDRFEATTAEFVTNQRQTAGAADFQDSWTLQDFRQWADAALDDLALDVVMHRLFLEGILPSPSLERELVLDKWLEWQVLSSTNKHDDGRSVTEMLTNSVSALLGSWQMQPSNGENHNHSARLGVVWGGLGGIDGLGGIGHGVMYCIPAAWWDSWTDYTGWSFVGERPHKRPKSRSRPASLETESLLEQDPEYVIRGIYGSYEVMRQGLRRGRDYVLVPPGVWDMLFELYSGGPPLPRMVKSPDSVARDPLSALEESNNLRPGNNSNDELDEFMGDLGAGSLRVMRIPDRLSVETHPWILHVHLCDPLQPYRRGDTGPLSIRVMASPNQSLWRLFSEIACRFSLQSYKAFNADGRGIARLWKKMDANEAKDSPLPRYGPWNLLCKGRHAMLPLTTNGVELGVNYDAVISDWKQFGDDATVESIGLTDQESLILEFAVQNKNGDLTWPREAAAKAGKVRRLAEEDKMFRQLLRGVDDEGNLLAKAPNLVGLDVDAMDQSGRWYTVKILDVEVVDFDTDEDNEDDEESGCPSKEQTATKKKVKVNFKDHGGHSDWIDVESDRLQDAGRFASECNLETSTSPTNSNAPNGESRAKSLASAKRASSHTESTLENTKSCALPGFGSCGLTNLGNTCYMNSAVQCMAYLPLLRAYLLGSQYKATGDLNKDNPLGTGGKLLEEFAELQRSVWSARVAEKSPNRFRMQLGKTNDQFAGADQQDAQEFLNYMIDVLHEDSNKVRKKPFVEPLDDKWVEMANLPRVGEEAWRRFLRRNQSIMADVAMGQALNTVTCPVCHYASRNFDPFNLLSIPIPTVADVIFQCTVIRRSTARNCPWVLNISRKNDSSHCRFVETPPVKSSGPPSETHIAEQYVIALSRLADGGDLRLQIQNLSGIRATQLRLCRAEEIIRNTGGYDGSVTTRQINVFPLADKEGPASQHAKKRTSNEDCVRAPTHIIAFELTINPRQTDNIGKNDEIDEVVNESFNEDDVYISREERAEIEKHLAVYGDEKECRLVDTDPLVIAKAVSRSLWPRSDSELKIGLRVDAKDHRGNWFPGSIIEIFDDDVNGGDSDTGQEVMIQQKKVRIHFDNFLSKWDEVYSIDHFKKGRVNPLYSHAEQKMKPTEFVVYHRFTDRTSGQSSFFGQPFYIQCKIEWSNARAGAHILAQASRFLQLSSEQNDQHRLSDRVNASISELIDILIDFDREYVRLALGVSKHNSEAERARPYRNPKFDGTALISASSKKISAVLHRLPFELRLCNADVASTDKNVLNPEEEVFPFALNITIGNFVSTRHAVVLHWRESVVDKKSGTHRNVRPSIMYVEPTLHAHKSSAELLNGSGDGNLENDKKRRPCIDLGFCLSEFCKVQKLPMSDNWKCPRCNAIREGGQNMNLWRLPDLLTFHVKRFNMSARWHEKITTKVNFPMTGLNMSEWCHKDSPVLREESDDSYIYDLIGVMNHYGSMTGGHYVATCKATLCGREGREEVAYNFNGVGTSVVETQESDEPSGWGLGRSKPKVNQSRVDAAASSKAVADSAEPMWLHFDDEVVEAVPPQQVVSEMAYVLFYRRRRITPSNIAKYSTLE